MKKALLLFAALLVAGCGEKSSSKGGWLNKDPEYPAEWPNLGESSGEWLTHPLSEAEVDQLEVILASVDRLDSMISGEEPRATRLPW